MPPIIDRAKCQACGVCMEICPTDVYFGSAQDKVPSIQYPEECWHCKACVNDCPHQAISLRVALPMLVVYK
jgi:adenylylsulfate reductase, subunit B